MPIQFNYVEARVVLIIAANALFPLPTLIDDIFLDKFLHVANKIGEMIMTNKQPNIGFTISDCTMQELS